MPKTFKQRPKDDKNVPGPKGREAKRADFRKLIIEALTEQLISTVDDNLDNLIRCLEMNLMLGVNIQSISQEQLDKAREEAAAANGAIPPAADATGSVDEPPQESLIEVVSH